MISEGKIGRVFVGRLQRGTDLLAELTRIAAENRVRCGRVEAIGAAIRARAGYYDQSDRKYGYLEWNEPMEILALTGNISEKAEAPGKPFVHAHVTLADEQGRAFGGHLVEGIVVFAAEFCIMEIVGPQPVRRPDEATGLALWG
jgi:predicted DNA-binding protein with PD1-like motif